MNNKETIIQQIHQTLKEQQEAGASLNTENLLLAGNKLSTLRFNLSDLWVEAREDYQQTEAYYKSNLDQGLIEARDTGLTIEECKALARQESKEALIIVIQKEKEMNQLKCMREDVAIKISNIQSFSSELRSQRGMGGLQ